ncbi:MAG TPA: YbhB/YbcL family Raf kinase inhibitor-like protein [Rhizomicrobium sp.]|nr:YbhB/YbcL family Raf kinase inhibitor-like protein [Rhizomicrobium sp.]
MFRSWMVAALLAANATQGAAAMELNSGQMQEGAMIAAAQVNSRCGGGNISPSLSWSGAPGNAQSFALTMFDPDANQGKGFWHWAVFDIPVSTTSLALGSVPLGARIAQNDFGDTHYDGPCPPPGSVHRYIFTLWALDTPSLSLASNAMISSVVPELQKHAITRAMLTPRYGR